MFEALRIHKGDMRYDFEKDVLKWGENTLNRLGYMSKNKTDDAISILAQVFGAVRNLIPPVPRRVEVAEGFSCPQKHLKGYNQVISEIRQGKDLSPRGSRLQRNSSPHVDGMLVDWGIHHLHLGTKFIKRGRSKGLIEGGKEVVFVFFNHDCAYVIGIFDHQSWTKEWVVERIEKNWPDLLEPFRINRTVDLSKDVSDIDRVLLRKHHINTPVKIGASIFFGPGGGFVAAGLGVNEVEKAAIVLRAVGDLIKWVSENENQLETILSEFNQEVEREVLHFEVSKYILSRTYTLRTVKSAIRLHIPSSDEPAALVHPSIAKVIEPIAEKYSYIEPSLLEGGIYIEKSEFEY